MMLETYWTDLLGKSDSALVKILSESDLDSLETDMPLLPDSIYNPNLEVRNHLDITPQYLSDKFKSGSNIVVYTSVYVEYVDLSGKNYNVLYTRYAIINIENINNKVLIIHSNGLENYRWDLFPEDTLL